MKELTTVMEIINMMWGLIDLCNLQMPSDI